MISKQKQKIYKRPIFLALSCLLLVGAVLLVLELTNVTHIFHQSVADKQKQAAAKVDLQKKQATINSQTNSSTGGDKSAPNSSTNYTAPTNPDNIVLSAQQSSSDAATITTKLYSYSDGQCELTVTNSGAQYKKSAPVIYQSEFSTCAGFNVPVSSLGPGTWNISLSVTSGGISQVKTTTLEVK
jgi:hypothetical protein